MSLPPRHLLAGPLCILAVVVVCGCGSGAPDHPNVLLITLDTVRADHLGSYGHPKDITPNLDRLARQGTRFETAISTSAVTPVSHASILTGRNPYAHGLRVIFADGGFRLEKSVPTLASVLRAAGYRTGAALSSFTVSGYFGLDRGFDFFDGFETSLLKRESSGFRDWDTVKSQRRADATTGSAIAFLAAGKGPFFLWVHYWDMHDVLKLPDEAFMPPPTELKFSSSGNLMQSPALYAAEIRFVDHHLGPLLEALGQRGLEEGTLIAVVSDHGQGLGDHGWFGHQILYQEQIRVPLLLRIPGVAGGREVKELVRSIDLLPTLLDYAGLPLPKGVQGRSLRPLMEGREDSPRLAYADQLNLFDKNASMILRRPWDDLLYSVQDQGWKLIYRPTRPEHSELYNLAQDPAETENLFRFDHEHARRLLARLGEHDGWLRQPPRGATMDPEARKRLAALGYVEEEEKKETRSRPPIAWSYTAAADFGHQYFSTSDACVAETHSPCVLVRRPRDGSP